MNWFGRMTKSALITAIAFADGKIVATAQVFVAENLFIVAVFAFWASVTKSTLHIETRLLGKYLSFVHLMGVDMKKIACFALVTLASTEIVAFFRMPVTAIKSSDTAP